MANARLNVAALYAALDAERSARGSSWRQLAKEVEISPSTLTRMANGHRPDVDAFAALTRWLNAPSEAYLLYDTEEQDKEPELLTQLAPLLRARKDLTEKDVTYLEDLVGAAVRRFQAERAES
jgi:transcriptional regulator with XRE-family HTH domain